MVHPPGVMTTDCVCTHVCSPTVFTALSCRHLITVKKLLELSDEELQKCKARLEALGRTPVALLASNPGANIIHPMGPRRSSTHFDPREPMG